MPIEMERALMAEASKKGLKGKHYNAYVYGTMRRSGWRPEREKKALLGSSLDTSFDWIADILNKYQ